VRRRQPLGQVHADGAHRDVDRPRARREDTLLAEDHGFERRVIGQHADDDLARRGVARTVREARPDRDQRLGLPGVRFQTATWWPAMTRLSAITPPIRPRPTTPISMTSFLCCGRRPGLFLRRRLLVGATWPGDDGGDGSRPGARSAWGG
jgi:hypothetical protein